MKFDVEEEIKTPNKYENESQSTEVTAKSKKIHRVKFSGMACEGLLVKMH